MAAEGTQVGSIFYALDLDDSKFTSKVASNKAQASSLGESVGKVGDSISKAGSAFLPFSIAAGAALGIAANAAINFDQQMELVHTQAGASQQEVDTLKDKVLALAEATGVGPDKLAEGLYHVESVGFRGAQAMDILKIAAEGAQIGQASLDDTTYALTSTLSSQVQGAQNASEAMATLNAIVGSGDMHMQDLNGAISTGFLNSAKAFGLSLTSTGAALATLTDNGESAEEAATRLRMTFSLMAAPSGAAEKALQSFGLSGRELAVDLQKPDGMNVALTDLKTHLQTAFGPDSIGSLKSYSDILSKQGADAADKYANSVGGAAEALSKAFGGGRSDAAILTLLNNTDRLSTKFDDINSKSKDFNKTWADQQQTAKQKMDDFKASLSVLEVKLGNAFLPILENLAKSLGKLADSFGRLSPHTQKLIVDALLVVAALGPVLKVIGTVARAVGYLVGFVEELWGFITMLGEAFGLLAAIIGIPVEALAAIVAAVIAVVVAIVLMLTHWKKTKEIAAEVWHAVSGFFERMWHDVAGFFERMWNDTAGFFENMWHDITGFAEQIWHDVTGFFSDMWDDIVARVKGFIGDVIQIFRNLFDFFTGGDITLTANHLSAPFVKWVKFLLEVRDDVIQWVKDVIDWFEQTPHHILQVFDAIAYIIGFQLRILWNLFTKWIPDIVRAVISELMKLPGQVASILTTTWNTVTSFLTKMWNDAYAITTSTISRMWNDTYVITTSFLSRMWNDIYNWFSRMINDIINFFSRLPGETSRWFSSMWSQATSWASRIWSDVVGWFSRTVDDVTNWLAQLPGRIINFFSSLWSSSNHAASGVWHGFMDTINQLPDLVGKIGDAIWGKITGMAGKLADGAKHVASSIWNSFKDGLGIHSPSYIERAFTAIANEGDNTVDSMKQSVNKLSDLSHKATQVTMGNKNSGLGGVNNTMAFANLAINGDINFQNQSDINYFFQKLGRNVELTNQGLTATR